MNSLSNWILKKVNFKGIEEFSERKYKLYDTHDRELYNFIVDLKPEYIVCSELAYDRFSFLLQYSKSSYAVWNNFLKDFKKIKTFDHFLLSMRTIKRKKKFVFVFKEHEINEALFKMGYNYHDSDIILFKAKDQWKFRFFDTDLPF
jgi:hypothetical protein